MRPVRGPSRHFAGYVLDLDGTVYLGDRPIDGAPETIAALRASGSRVVFLTNKPLERPSAYAAKLDAMGIPAGPNDVVSSTDALVSYLAEHGPIGSILPITEPLLETILEEAGHRITREPGEADVVVVSWDRTFDYEKLERAFRAVRRGARLIATNPDPFCPTPDGGLPDCAAMLAAIEVSTGARAEAIVGKPSAHMSRTILGRLELAPADVLLVGDRLLTDVRMAREAGMAAGLVLTGVTRAEEVPELPDGPDIVLERLADLLSTIPGSTS